MTPAELLTKLRERGVAVGVDGGELDIDGPEAVLKPAVLDAIRTHKPALLVLLRDEEVTALRALADGIGARMQRLSAVPADEWAAFRDQLGADDDQLRTGLQRSGLRLEDAGWTVAGPGCHWRRIDESTPAAPRDEGTLFDIGEETPALASPWR